MNLYPYLKLLALVLAVLIMALFLIGEFDASISID